MTTKTETLTLVVDASSLLGRLSGNEQIIVDVFAERDRQDAQWGGPVHDDTHSAWDWCEYIEYQLAHARHAPVPAEPGKFRERMIKIAALAFAAIASYDRVNTPSDLDTSPGEPEHRAFGKQELLDYLDAALPEELGIRAFNLNYWAQLGPDKDGTDALQRAMAATREYQSLMVSAQSIAVGMDFTDGSISIEVEA